jgi:hypothetical protein
VCAILILSSETANTKNTMTPQLIDLVIEQIEHDFSTGEMLPLETLLQQVPESVLVSFLGDKKLEQYFKEDKVS